MVRRSRRALRALYGAVAAMALASAACATTGAVKTPPPGGHDGALPGDPSPSGEVVLTLVNHRAACVVAAHPTLAFRDGDALLAELEVGASASVKVQPGAHAITVDDGLEQSPRTVDVGPDGATLTETCPPHLIADRFRGQALVPLTLVGPDAACAPDAQVKARAGGLVIELTSGERTTIYLPRGAHIVRILGDGAHDATVDLGDAGAELVLMRCGSAQSP